MAEVLARFAGGQGKGLQLVDQDYPPGVNLVRQVVSRRGAGNAGATDGDSTGRAFQAGGADLGIVAASAALQGEYQIGEV
jgi:hypothetical protein